MRGKVVTCPECHGSGNVTAAYVGYRNELTGKIESRMPQMKCNKCGGRGTVREVIGVIGYVRILGWSLLLALLMFSNINAQSIDIFGSYGQYQGRYNYNTSNGTYAYYGPYGTYRGYYSPRHYGGYNSYNMYGVYQGRTSPPAFPSHGHIGK